MAKNQKINPVVEWVFSDKGTNTLIVLLLIVIFLVGGSYILSIDYGFQPETEICLEWDFANVENQLDACQKWHDKTENDYISEQKLSGCYSGCWNAISFFVPYIEFAKDLNEGFDNCVKQCEEDYEPSTEER